MKPVKMIVAGCANPHVAGYLRGISDLKGCVEFLALSDSDEARLNRFRGLVGDSANLAYYTNIDNMLEAHPDADAIMVGSDNSDHYQMCVKAFERNLHIYSMKVVSMDEEECEKLLQLQKKSERIFQVEFELHFSPQFTYARDLVRSGELGEIKSVYMSNISQCPICYYPNWGVPELSYGKRIPLYPGADIYRGGALTDHPHPFDLLKWVLGREFQTVRAMSARNQRSYLEVEDHMVIAGEMEDQIKYMINPSYSNQEERGETRKLLWPKSLECNLKITGTKGFYSADYFDHPLYVLGHNCDSPDRLIVHANPVEKRDSLLGSFAKAVRGELRHPESTLEDGIAAVKVMNAAYDSVYYDKTVDLGARKALTSPMV